MRSCKLGLVPTMRVCEQCGADYTSRGKRFCSNSCSATWRNLTANPAKSPAARAKIAALRRGKPTTAGRTIPESQRENISRALAGRTLTAEHREAIGAGVRLAGCVPPRNDHLVGPNHPNWKGGHSTARQADFSSPAYKAFRAAVMERDDWTCHDCKKRGGRLHAHHLEAWAERPDLRYEPANAISLCPPCHHARHRGVPRPRGVGPRTRAELRSSQT